jgi:cell division topological specificity factor
VNVDVEAIQVNFERDGGHEVLELSVALPERPVVTGSVAEPA